MRTEGDAGFDFAQPASTSLNQHRLSLNQHRLSLNQHPASLNQHPTSLHQHRVSITKIDRKQKN
jgi:hypothetical protein